MSTRKKSEQTEQNNNEMLAKKKRKHQYNQTNQIHECIGVVDVTV